MAPLNLPASIPPEYIPSKNTATVILAVAAAAAAVPVAYLVAVRRSCLKRARICDGKPPAFPSSLPDDVKAAYDEGSDEIVLSHERLTSIPVAVSSLRPELQVEDEGLDVVLTPYVRATFTSWLDTYGGRATKRAIDDLEGTEQLRGTFAPEAIQGLNFEVGDRVCGIYEVTHRGESADGERVELRIDLPPGWTEARKSPIFDGIIVAGWEVLEPESGKEEEEGINLVFVNETWLWRKKGQRKTILERGLGRWWHSGLAGWMIGKGIDAVTTPAKHAKKSTKKAASTPAPAAVKVIPEKQPLKEETETETETETSDGSEEE